MELNDYHALAMRTDNDEAYKSESTEQTKSLRLLNGMMGLNGEAGELIDLYKKSMFQGHDLFTEDVIEELGDALWYIVLCCKAIGVTLEDVARANVDKLTVRYPEGFSTEDSIERRDHDQDGKPELHSVRNES